MPQVKVYGLQRTVSPLQTALSDAIHNSLMAVFKTPFEKRFQRFIWLADEDFVFPRDRVSAGSAGRTDYYTIIEISLFTGRSVETKKQLIRQLYAQVAAATPITPQDLEITLFESPPSNWGIRGVLGDELTLSYPVNL
ncbi:MAG: tautomerase family protein [Cyanobacteria bacterium P01_F01_bin.4]